MSGGGFLRVDGQGNLVSTGEQALPSYDPFMRSFWAGDARPSEVRYAKLLTLSDAIVPVKGTALRLRKIGWDPVDGPNEVLLQWRDDGHGARPIWRGRTTEQFVCETGDIGRALDIVLLTANPVSVNLHYQVIDTDGRTLEDGRSPQQTADSRERALGRVTSVVDDSRVIRRHDER